MITIKYNRLELSEGDRILDIGCGEGRHTIKSAQQDGLICVGADFGHDNLVTTREKLGFHEQLDDLACQSWDLCCSDITAMNFKNRSFDCVVCSEVLEHIPDDDTAIDEILRILKPGKILAVSVPRFWPEKICWMLSDQYFNVNQGHVRIYNKREIIRKIESKGARFLESHHAHSIHSPFWWLKCLIGPERTDALPVKLYHRLLVWDLMKKPWLTRFIDDLLNPVLGKSLVMYFRKQAS